MLGLAPGPYTRFVLKFVEVKSRLRLNENVYPFCNHFPRKSCSFAIEPCIIMPVKVEI